jgi:hypothetical protein
MTEDEARRILDRYRSSPAYPVPGKPFGWSIVELKYRIRTRLIARGITDPIAHFKTENIYHRIMRYKPTFSQYCQAINVLRPAAPSSPPSFTTDELRHLVELFTGANDPLSLSIAEKAKAILDNP